MTPTDKGASPLPALLNQGRGPSAIIVPELIARAGDHAARRFVEFMARLRDSNPRDVSIPAEAIR